MPVGAQDGLGAPAAVVVMRYFERLRAADVPPAMWPVRLIVDEPAAGAAGDAGAALLFDDLACVSLGGLIRQTAGRDPVLALRIAGSLTRAVYALAQVDYALEPAALDGLVIGAARYEIGPIDPSALSERPQGGDDAAGRYAIVGAALLALVTGEPARLDAAGEIDRQLPATLRAVI